ncbi:MAG TPA: M42 family metallopeptidase [Chloroflexi bacterium]|nr:M42 family metallopeptidase [Chloroflexota bacterium]
MIDLTALLKEWISLPGLSGNEDPIRESIAAAWKPLTDELSVSRLGSLHGLLRGEGPEPRPRILLAAHMDAIGLMVTEQAGDLLRITMVGGVDHRILPGTLVTVHGRRDLPGVVVSPPERLLPPSAAGKPVKMEHLLVDTGLTADELSQLVRTGDLISFAQQPLDLTGETLAGHSLDNRASVAALTVCLEELRRMRPAWDTWAAATVQEEETFAGGYTSPFELEPDLAVAVDVTHAAGPGADGWRTVPLGKGPALGIGPNVHPAVHNRFKEVADRMDMEVTVEPMPAHSGTDAYPMQVTGAGIPTMVVSIPLRYMHTPVEVVSLKDIRKVGRLLAQFIATLEVDFIKNIRWEGEE